MFAFLNNFSHKILSFFSGQFLFHNNFSKIISTLQYKNRKKMWNDFWDEGTIKVVGYSDPVMPTGFSMCFHYKSLKMSTNTYYHLNSRNFSRDRKSFSKISRSLVVKGSDDMVFGSWGCSSIRGFPRILKGRTILLRL